MAGVAASADVCRHRQAMVWPYSHHECGWLPNVTLGRVTLNGASETFQTVPVGCGTESVGGPYLLAQCAGRSRY